MESAFDCSKVGKKFRRNVSLPLGGNSPSFLIGRRTLVRRIILSRNPP
jgi:hypothetical protein